MQQILDHKIFGVPLSEPIFFGLKVLIIIIVAKIALIVVRRLFHRADKRSANVLDVTGRRYFERICRFIIYVIAISSVLVLIPGMEKIGNSLLTSAGILAAAIGLAAQEALSNFIGGLFIIISKPFRVGDYIQIDADNRGTVKEITLRHTVILNAENRTIIVPNSKINSNTIVNSTAVDPKTCAFVEINIAYTENIDRAIEVMRDVILQHPLLIDVRSEADIEAGKPQVRVKVISLDDSSIRLRAWAWATTTLNAFEMKCDLLKSIKERFDAEGIEIPYPYYNQIVRSSN
ncbi:MAG: mechanosensitive ion channel family protein [Bacteroidaceae bacterium]|nr:mechanosensitive ion channel family protein [Bacteroidaceae bacterium]